MLRSSKVFIYLQLFTVFQTGAVSRFFSIEKRGFPHSCLKIKGFFMCEGNASSGFARTKMRKATRSISPVGFL